MEKLAERYCAINKQFAKLASTLPPEEYTELEKIASDLGYDGIEKQASIGKLIGTAARLGFRGGRGVARGVLGAGRAVTRAPAGTARLAGRVVHGGKRWGKGQLKEMKMAFKGKPRRVRRAKPALEAAPAANPTPESQIFKNIPKKPPTPESAMMNAASTGKTPPVATVKPGLADRVKGGAKSYWKTLTGGQQAGLTRAPLQAAKSATMATRVATGAGVGAVGLGLASRRSSQPRSPQPRSPQYAY